MSVRKRTWTNQDGSQGETWVVAYSDQGGKRRIRSFEKKRDADAFHASVATDLRAGLHVPDRDSVMVAEAGRLWLKSCEAAELERASLTNYRQLLKLHVIPLLGAVKLSRLTVPMVRAFTDKLSLDRSPYMVRRVRSALGMILADAQEQGLVGQNVVRALHRGRRGRERRAQARQKGRLKVGVDIPTPNEIRALVAALAAPEHVSWRPMLLTAIFAGLRASELRGLRWDDINLKRSELHVRQRADCYNVIGRPKSETSERTIPLPPMLVNVLREHRLKCPKSELDLVFPTGDGRIVAYNTIVRHGLAPALIAAAITAPVPDAQGKPVKDPEGRPAAKYRGLHALRHFYASWCINRRVDGGLELPLKVVQARLGHASIQITADRYGHLFPRGDDGAELAAAELAFLGV
jgi:integrase